MAVLPEVADARAPEGEADAIIRALVMLDFVQLANARFADEPFAAGGYAAVQVEAGVFQDILHAGSDAAGAIESAAKAPALGDDHALFAMGNGR